MKSAAVTGLIGLLVAGCDDPQYVSPDTVALIVTNDATGVERVNRCHYVPVLLGSQEKARYVVQDQLRATITLTRDDVSVVFDDGGDAVASLVVESRTFAGEAHVTAEDPPRGFSVELASPCEPGDF